MFRNFSSDVSEFGGLGKFPHLVFWEDSWLVGDADGLSAAFFSAFGVLRFFRPCFLIVLFGGAIHVLADGF